MEISVSNPHRPPKSFVVWEISAVRTYGIGRRIVKEDCSVLLNARREGGIMHGHADGIVILEYNGKKRLFMPDYGEKFHNPASFCEKDFCFLKMPCPFD